MDKNKFNAFINSIELLEEIIPEFHWRCKVPNIETEKTKIKLNLKTIQPNVFENYFECGNTLEIIGVSFKKEILFTIKGTIILRIKYNADVSQEYIDYYSINTVKFSTIPTFRILVKDALQKMGLPPFTLPFLKDNLNQTQNKKKN